MPAAANLRINPDRLWDSLMEMAKIGPGVAGGNNRQALTDADAEGRALFARWCGEAGLELGIDEMGSMFATRPGTDAQALPVYVGSHLDTQPTGGRFDGVLGVLAALEIVRTLNDLDIRTRRPIVVTNWTNEEGARFAPAIMASGVFAGAIDRDQALDSLDGEGRRFGDELERIGWKGSETAGARRMHAFFELHIEQGPILEAEGRDVGIVTHGQGVRWVECTLTGRGQHTGTTPMGMRRDAGRGLARLIELVNEIAMQHQPNAVGSVGHVVVHPNSPNVIPEKVVLTADFRSHVLETLEAMAAALEARAPVLCAELGLEFSSRLVSSFDPPAFDPALLERLRGAAERLGYSHRDIISGAGHDACQINKVAPAAMLFCPCEGGLSHNEAEAISREWAQAGADVLCQAVVETAEILP
ncbi:MAG: Zn-dependent hydrolase [Pararhodobacter sp.]|nr:Zn-dependent hydrolase [Pararhodobacter sp.]